MVRALDKRITLVTFLLATAVMALFAVLIGIASDRIEHGVLDQLVIREYGAIQRNLARGDEKPLLQTAQLQSWLTSRPDDEVVPEAFRDLSIGIHHEVSREGSQYHVMREPIEDKFLTLAYQINLVEDKEDQFKIVLGLTVLLGPALLMLLFVTFTRRMTEPVTKLAHKLQNLDPSKRGVRLEDEFQGQEVEAIARAFDRYQERLELMVEREQSFSAAASHELRSPLAVISASAELLSALDQLPDTARRQLRRIEDAVSNMAEVVNSLLAMSRDQFQRPRAPLHIKPVIEEAAANFQDQIADKPVSLQWHCDDELTRWIPVGDFLIILGNLVHNAIRNTETGSIRIDCTQEALVVTDTGRGMPREFAEHIFDKHVQAHDSHGVGLGLHIVKRFCDRYGWPVQVESALGEGSSFRIFWSRDPWEPGSGQAP